MNKISQGVAFLIRVVFFKSQVSTVPGGLRLQTHPAAYRSFVSIYCKVQGPPGPKMKSKYLFLPERSERVFEDLLFKSSVYSI